MGTQKCMGCNTSPAQTKERGCFQWVIVKHLKKQTKKAKSRRMSDGEEKAVPPGEGEAQGREGSAGEESGLSVAAVGDFLLRRGFKLSALELFEEAREAGVPEGDLGRLAGEFSRAGGRTTACEHHAYKPGRVAFGTEKEKDEYLFLLEYELRIAREDLDAERLKVDALTHGRTTPRGVLASSGAAPTATTASSDAAADSTQSSAASASHQQQEGQDQEQREQQQKRGGNSGWQAALCAKRRAAHTAAIVAGGPRAEGRVADTVRGLRDLGGEAGMVELVAECLPNVVRGVIMSKRDEVVPLLLETVLRHKDAETRTALLKLLLALLKQPDEQQRALLVEAVAVLAELMGAARASAELVPPLVLDCASKYEERRILVATVCGAVAPFVTADTRAKTLRNVCVQMINDRNDLVRRAAVRALARLVTLFGRDDAALLMPLEEEFCRLLDDRSEVVVEAALGALLAALVDFADATDQLPALCAKLAAQAAALLAQLAPPPAADDANSDSDDSSDDSGLDRAALDQRTAPAERLFKCLDACIPRFCERLLTSLPGAQPPACIAGAATATSATSDPSTSSSSTSGASVWVSREEKEAYVALLGDFVRAHPLESLLEGTTDGNDDDSDGSMAARRSVAWTARELLPALFRVAERAPACDGSALDGATALVRLLARELGAGFQTAVLAPVLRQRLAALPATAPARARLLVVWLAAAAGAQPDTEIRQCVFDVVSDMAQDGRAWTMAHVRALRHATDLLAQPAYGAHQSLLLRVLSELSSSPSVRIRAVTAALYSGVVPHISAESTKLSVFSVLAALHTDPDAAVRGETCQVFVAILQCFPHDRDLAERTTAALDMLAQDQCVAVRTALCRAVARFSTLISAQLFFTRLPSTHLRTRMALAWHSHDTCTHVAHGTQTSPRSLRRSHRRCAASTAARTRARSASRCGTRSRRSGPCSRPRPTTPPPRPSSPPSRRCSPTRPASAPPRSRTSTPCLCLLLPPPSPPSLLFFSSVSHLCVRMHPSDCGRSTRRPTTSASRRSPPRAASCVSSRRSEVLRSRLVFFFFPFLSHLPFCPFPVSSAMP